MMRSDYSRIEEMARRVVSSTMKALPDQVRGLAESVPVIFEAEPDADDPEVLGLFIGDPYSAEFSSPGGSPPQIILFLSCLWEEADGDLRIYKQEVRTTYLHELGHYLGFDEVDMEERGID